LSLLGGVYDKEIAQKLDEAFYNMPFKIYYE